jgi:hypothetical protein
LCQLSLIARLTPRKLPLVPLYIRTMFMSNSIESKSTQKIYVFVQNVVHRRSDQKWNIAVHYLITNNRFCNKFKFLSYSRTAVGNIYVWNRNAQSKITIVGRSKKLWHNNTTWILYDIIFKVESGYTIIDSTIPRIPI